MDAAAQRPTVAQYALGFFVSWQLLFMPAANYLAFFPHGQAEEGELSDSRRAPSPDGTTSASQKAIDLAAGVTDAWSYLTGQVQAWWLFAPDVPRASTFPIVEARWEEDHESPTVPPMRLRSILEPCDRQCYFRPPSSFDRLFHYEVRLGLIFSNWNERTFAENPEFWRGAILDRVRRQWRSTRAYLRWYVRSFQRDNPGMPSPKQLILWIRIYPIPQPGQSVVSWAAPMEQPLARWRPDWTPEPGQLPIEAFD
ncbi:MAG TPA: hypothetical protein VKU02_22730, partial [Gemmataceae bacterium]|nr:hypothetical protein [Gemmataceae bacterium]